jgi:hypothetical protein
MVTPPRLLVRTVLSLRNVIGPPAGVVAKIIPVRRHLPSMRSCRQRPVSCAVNADVTAIMATAATSLLQRRTIMRLPEPPR